MTDFLIYNLKAGFILSVLYLLYVMLLRKETFYGFNRIYLLGTLVISFLLPALSISIVQPVDSVQNNFVYAEQVFLEVRQTLNFVESETANNVNSFPVLTFLLLIGMSIASLRIGFQLFSIYIKIRKHDIKTQGKYKFVLMNGRATTHSFFNFIFILKSDFNNIRSKEVLLHEQIHADKWHSLDLMIVGFLTILQWFNPFIYLFKRSLAEIHEFQTDQEVMNCGVEKYEYQQLLLGEARSAMFAGLTNKFNQSLIKNRLKMMNKVRSKNRAVIKYFIVAPILFVLSVVFAVSQNSIDTSIQRVLSYENGEISFQYEESNISYEASDSLELMDGLVFLNGHAKVDTKNSSLKAERIIINTNERMVYIFSDDNIPSIYPVEKKYLKWPAAGFGIRIHPILKTKKMHNGMDFPTSKGTPIMTTASGIVRKADIYKTDGKFVVVDHGNRFSTKYSHLSEFIVDEKQFVERGDIIGYVGITGMSKSPHLHYEIIKDGDYVDPKDYLGESSEK